MDMIGRVKYIENSLGGRKSNQGSAGKKNIQPVARDRKKQQTESHPVSNEYDTRIGRKLDVNA
ncbi:MAG: hypothetical protein R8K48_08085 [Gallionella sp.]